jgi:hypothetical protein
MKFREVAGRLTGLSSPVFGVSWTPPEAEVTAARRVLAFLEDRRVLYDPTQVEIPEHCVASIHEIRQVLTIELGKMDHGNLAQDLRALRVACRKFLERIQQLEQFDQHGLSRPIGNVGPYISSMGSLPAWVFCDALGELRGVFGVHIAQIAARNGLDVEDQLATILPGKDKQE